MMIDLQSMPSPTKIYIDQVGVRDLKHPVNIHTRADGNQTTTATFTMAVGLAADQRGTHMSRFVEILNEKQWVLSVPGMHELIGTTATRFATDKVFVESKFTVFINKTAPVSKITGLVDYDIAFAGELLGNKISVSLNVNVPVTTLCPCSKEISDYGAHNQRSYINVKLTTDRFVYFEDLIKLIEGEASCEIYSILKRADEKYVTEKAYNNPRFVEDMVRNIAHLLDTDARFTNSYYRVSSENHESIHNHSAYAMVERRL